MDHQRTVSDRFQFTRADLEEFMRDRVKRALGHEAATREIAVAFTSARLGQADPGDIVATVTAVPGAVARATAPGHGGAVAQAVAVPDLGAGDPLRRAAAAE